MYHNKLTPFLISVLVFCFMAGCTHGGKSKNPPPAADKELIELFDAELEKTEDDFEEDDFFEDNDDEDFVIEDFEKEGQLVADPLYYFNISMYHFNDKLYFWCLKPVTNTYKFFTPEFFRIGVRNFFDCLSTPVRFTSCLLQGKFKGAGTEVGRLVINATLGFGGVIDTATHSFNITKADEDLGQVLGHYGIGNGFYLYLPLTGPTTLRDSTGALGGYFLDPVSYPVLYGYAGDKDLIFALSVWSKVNAVSFMIGNYEAVKSASLDPYTMIRDFYIEQRKKKIKE